MCDINQVGKCFNYLAACFARFTLVYNPVITPKLQPMSIKKTFQKNGLTCKVTFRLPAELAENAEKVCLVGDFNEWKKEELPLKKLKSGDFSITLSLKQGQAYQYRYLINGTQWINDPEADRYAESPYPGTTNSVLIL